MIVPDTSVWINHFKGVNSPKTKALDRLLGQELILVGDLIMTEILQGVKSKREFELVQSLLLQLQFEPMMGQTMAIKAAKNYRALREKGVTPKKSIDVWIATFCIEKGHSLLHEDRDFILMEKHIGLKSYSEW